jgi:hypothetical protein
MTTETGETAEPKPKQEEGGDGCGCNHFDDMAEDYDAKAAQVWKFHQPVIDNNNDKNKLCWNLVVEQATFVYPCVLIFNMSTGLTLVNQCWRRHKPRFKLKD